MEYYVAGFTDWLIGLVGVGVIIGAAAKFIVKAIKPFLDSWPAVVQAIATIADKATDVLREKYPTNDAIKYADELIDKIIEEAGLEDATKAQVIAAKTKVLKA